MPTLRTLKKNKTFCTRCRRWWSDHEHDKCQHPRAHESTTWVDVSTGEMSCDTCHEVWPLVENQFWCPCGHTQKTEYRDTAAALKVGGHVIATDGDVAYVQGHNGTLYVGRR